MKKLCLMLVCLLTLTGCTVTQLEVPKESYPEEAATSVLFDVDYFADLTPQQYSAYLAEIFISAIPLQPEAAELDCTVYAEYFPAGSQDADALRTVTTPDGDTIGIQPLEKLPVCYGLLAETERYLKEYDISFDEQAQPYGKAHALRVEDVQAMANLLLRRPTPLALASVAGADYIAEAGIFVYNALEDPFQPFYDKGWELYAPEQMHPSYEFGWGEAGETGKPDAVNLGADLAPVFYDCETGCFYDPHGRPLAVSHNLEGFLSSFELGSLLLSACGFTPRDRSFALPSVSVEYAQGIVGLDTEIAYLSFGETLCGTPAQGDYILPGNVLTPKELLHMEQQIFDDYYRDPAAGEKLTNYFTLCFYDAPEAFDVSYLPAASSAQLSEWTEQYLGLPLTSLQSTAQSAGSALSEPPRIALLCGSRVENRLTLGYYNEYQRSYAVLVLEETETGIRFLSNLPVTDFQEMSEACR